MLVFSGPDKALLDRAARMMEADAVAVAWESIEDPKKRKSAKLEYDRLKRDAHDLRTLALRLRRVAKVVASQAASKAAEVPAS